MYRQRLFDYYEFVVGLSQCSVLSYLNAQPPPPTSYDCTILLLNFNKSL